MEAPIKGLVFQVTARSGKLNFSIRSLLLFVLVAGCIIGLAIPRRNSFARKNAILELQSFRDCREWPAGRRIRGWPNYEKFPLLIQTFHSTEMPSWLTYVTGSECFDRLKAVNLSELMIKDQDLDCLINFRELEKLNLDNTAVTDSGGPDDIKVPKQVRINAMTFVSKRRSTLG